MSTLPAKYTFTAWQNATFRKVLTVLSGGQGSSPLDLTGYTGLMNLRTDPDAAPYYTLTTANNQIVLGGTAGTISLYIPASDTPTLQSGIFDLSVTAANGTGDTDPVLWGAFRLIGVS